MITTHYHVDYRGRIWKIEMFFHDGTYRAADSDGIFSSGPRASYTEALNAVLLEIDVTVAETE